MILIVRAHKFLSHSFSRVFLDINTFLKYGKTAFGMLVELAIGDAYGAGFEYSDKGLIARCNRDIPKPLGCKSLRLFVHSE